MIGTVIAELTWVVLVPLAAAAAAMLIARRYHLPTRAAWAVSFGTAFVVGQLGLTARAGPLAAVSVLLRPHEARDWLPWLVLLAAGVGALAAYAPRPWRPWVLGLAGLATMATPVRLLAGSVYVTTEWAIGQKLAHLALLAASLALVWLLLDEAKDRDQPRVRAGLLIVVAGGVAACLTRSGSFTYGELAGVVAAALAGSLAASLLGPSGRYAGGVGGAAGTLVMSLGSLLILGHFYAELSAADGILLALAMAAAGGRWPNMPLSERSQTLIRAVGCLVPLTWAIVRTVAAASAETASTPYA